MCFRHESRLALELFSAIVKLRHFRSPRWLSSNFYLIGFVNCTPAGRTSYSMTVPTERLIYR